MKRLLQFWLCFVVAVTVQSATLNYNLGDYTLNPTNVLLSNLVSTAQITWSMGQSGRITGTITFPTVFDENWTNIANVLVPTSANVRGLSWGTNNNLVAGTLYLTTPPSGQNTIYGLETATNISGGSGFNAFFGWHIASTLSTGEENTGIGSPVLESLTTGEQNTAGGSDALISLIDGNDNSAWGYGALTQARNSRNTGVGRGSGDGLTTGGGNTFLGWFADTIVTSVTNSTALGQNSILTLSNQMVFGSGVSNYQFNAVDYVFPTVNSGGALTNNGSGGLGWFSLASLDVLRTNFDNVTVTNVTKLMGQTIATNIYDGGWLEVVLPQTNRSDLYVAGAISADSGRITNGLNVGGLVAVSSLNVTNTLNASGTVGASILRVTNETTHLGPVTNHQALRATNIFNGGWTENVGPQTNRGKVDIAGALTADSGAITNTLNVAGTLGASILRVTNETTHVGPVTNHTSMRATNIFDGGWLEVVGPQTNRDKVDVAGKVTASILQITNEATMFGLQTNHTTLRGTNIFNGGWSHTVGEATNAGGIRATGTITVASASGLKLGTGATITNILSASAALTFTAVGSQRYVDASITVTGTTTNDLPILGVPFQVQQGVGGTNLIFSPFTSNDTVWVRCNNYGTATRSTNGVFNVLVFKR